MAVPWVVSKSISMMLAISSALVEVAIRAMPVGSKFTTIVKLYCPLPNDAPRGQLNGVTEFDVPRLYVLLVG